MEARGIIVHKSREVWLNEEVHDKACDTQKGIRLEIGMYYLQVLNSPSHSKWSGNHGTVAFICEVWDIPVKLRRRVRNVLEQLNTTGIEKFDDSDSRSINKGRP